MCFSLTLSLPGACWTDLIMCQLWWLISQERRRISSSEQLFRKADRILSKLSVFWGRLISRNNAFRKKHYPGNKRVKALFSCDISFENILSQTFMTHSLVRALIYILEISLVESNKSNDRPIRNYGNQATP